MTKRKISTLKDDQRPPRAQRICHSNKEEEDWKKQLKGAYHPWKNLELILFIQNKNIDIQKKLKLAFDFIESRMNEGADLDQGETVSGPRLLGFLNDWIQSLLISEAKSQIVEEEGYQAHTTFIYLDFRCWKVFKFCLEESLKLHVTLSFSCSLLRVFGLISENSLAQLRDASLGSKESFLVCGGSELYSTMPECLVLIFRSHDAALNENLDLWISTVKSVLDLVLNAIVSQETDSRDLNIFVTRFTCLILDPFSKFLRGHPCRRNGFRDFVDNLLERLLHLLGILGAQIDSDSSNAEMPRGLYKLAEEVLSLGLFHSFHIEGFLSLHTTEKHLTPLDEKTKDTKILIKSYHRHLFDQLEKIFFGKRVSLSCGIGELLRLLIYKVKIQKGSLPTPEGAYTPIVKDRRNSENDFIDNKIKVSSGKSQYSEKSLSSSSISAEMRKSLFDFFVQIVEPLFLEISSTTQYDLEAGPALFNAHCAIKHVNSMLATLMHENVYLRTEDTSEGACFNYLKKAYEIIASFSVKICHLSLATDESNKREKFNMVGSLAGELILAIGYFLEIEYDVVINDLVSLWLVIASYLEFGFMMDEKDQCSLEGKVLGFVCKLINLFRDLRQVDIILFALCKALRYLVSRHSGKETCFFGSNSCNTALSHKTYAKSVGRLICSQEIRVAMCGAIKSIPEGQVSGCIQQLTQDISESMDWLKDTLSLCNGEKTAQMDSIKYDISQFDLCLEVLGKGLSEIHSLVLGSVTVTIGNSNSVGNATKELVAVIRPCLSSLVQVCPDSLSEFVFSVTGRTGRVNDLLESGGPIQWIFLFLFQLYMSSRALFRLVISLAPPNSSSKMSALMGDTASSYSGSDWMEKTDWIDEGYFSWIVKPSASLLTVIQTIQGNYSLDSFTDTAPLIGVLHALALQRLVDLNRQIKSMEYLRQVNGYIFQTKLIDAAGLSVSCKKSTSLENHISLLRQEACDLVDFMMKHLSSEAREKHILHQNYGWPLEICSLNEHSLSVFLWRILCQNIDIWSTHASKKKLKMFLSHLIETSVLAKRGDHDRCEPSHPVKVTMPQISLGLLSSCILYEQEFVRRHFASRFCLALEKSVIALFNGFVRGCDDLCSLPDWHEVFRAIDGLSVQSSSNVEMLCNSSFITKTNSDLCSTRLPSISRDLEACESLLNLLCWMPKQHLSSKCFSNFTTAILNIERHVIDSLLESHSSLPPLQLLHLLLSCRRTVKCLIEAACEKVEASKCKFLLTVSEGSFLILWLLKSVSAILRVHIRFSDDSMNKVRQMMFSLMDHTSYIFLALSKNQFLLANHFLVAAEKISAEEGNSKKELNSIDAWENLINVAEYLKEQAECLVPSLKDGFYYRGKDKGEDDVCYCNLNQLSFLLSCLHGFLWGVASTLDAVSEKGNSVKKRGFNWMQEPLSKLVSHINVLAEFVNISSRFLLSECHQWPGISCDAESLPSSNPHSASVVTEESAIISGPDGDTECGKQKHERGIARSCQVSSDSNNENKITGMRQKISQSEKEKLLVNALDSLDSCELQCFNKPLLQSLLKGDNPEAASLLRHLFVSSSVVLRLSRQINSLFVSSMIPTYVGISQVLLLQLVNMEEVPPPFTFVWLDGVLKYLEELGNHFPLTGPKLTRNVYSKLINLHLRVKGRCISLQGKRATLASHETESSTKMINNDIGMCDASLFHKCWDEFNARLRTSFKVFINQPSELHLLSAIQALERALVGVKEDCTMIYEIQISSAGGKVSSTVAAGVDFLDLVLEFVTGQKRLNLVKRHMQSLVAGLFNIILHLQSSLIFYEKTTHNEADTYPDAGAVILMCIEVLTKVSGKHALFHMDVHQIGQSLRIPGALFHVFHHLKLSEFQVPNSSLSVLCTEGCNHTAGIIPLVVDRRFSVDLYAACCRLLYTALKHHKSECEHCIPLLEDSVAVLLHCLEIVENSSATRIGYFVWQVQEGVKCASFLRRIYEELRQQKDVFGRLCFLFLSNYIQVYSGYGPQKTGIRREVDEVLRPGVYALIDACSADDLQHLHTVFGEGPCRSTLAMLQNDYKLNFQYEGKV